MCVCVHVCMFIYRSVNLSCQYNMPISLFCTVMRDTGGSGSLG